MEQDEGTIISNIYVARQMQMEPMISDKQRSNLGKTAVTLIGYWNVGIWSLWWSVLETVPEQIHSLGTCVSGYMH